MTTGLRLSRFAVVRRIESGPLVIESPLAPTRARLDAPAADTALHHLAAGAIGAGDSDRFARVAGTRYVEETSVGEFALPGPAGAA